MEEFVTVRSASSSFYGGCTTCVVVLVVLFNKKSTEGHPRKENLLVIGQELPVGKKMIYVRWLKMNVFS